LSNRNKSLPEYFPLNEKNYRSEAFCKKYATNISCPAAKKLVFGQQCWKPAK